MQRPRANLLSKIKKIYTIYAYLDKFGTSNLREGVVPLNRKLNIDLVISLIG
jgi:hypothetical protein